MIILIGHIKKCRFTKNINSMNIINKHRDKKYQLLTGTI